MCVGAGWMLWLAPLPGAKESCCVRPAQQVHHGLVEGRRPR